MVLVEGEKAADALRGRGIRALGTVTGASSTPGADALAVLEGNKVVLWPDADDQGRKHMLRIAERLQGVAASVRYFEWSEAPEKGDAADHRAVRTGEGMGELKRALGSAPEVGEESSPEGALSANRLVRHRVQLAGILGREPEPPPFQQPGVLVRGALHLFFGAPECGKSWFALWLTVHAINRGERVLYLDSENGKRLVAQRLEALGAREDAVRDYLHYLPHPDLDLTGGAKEDFEQFLDEVEPELVVFDSWVNFLSQSGLSEDSSTEVEAWCQAYAFPARNRGITVAILDHTPHDMDRPRGSSRKTAVVDYSRNVRKRKDFDRETVGEVQLYGGKDREGVMPREVTFAVGPSDKGRPIFRPHSGVVEQPSTADGLKPSERRVLGILRDEFGETGATHSSWLKAFEKDRRAHGEEGSGRATFKRAKNRLLDLGMVAGFTPQTDQCRVQNPVSPTSENQYPRDTEFRVVSGHAGSGPNGRREPYFSAKVSQQSNSGSLGFKSGSRSGEPEKESRVHRVTPPIGGEPVSPTFPAHGEISIEDYPGEDDQIEVLI